MVAAEIVSQMMLQEGEGEGGESSRGYKKIVFLAPTADLVEQQAQVLLEYDSSIVLHRPGEPPPRSSRRRLGVVCAGLQEASLGWRCAAESCQLIVTTPALLERALTHAETRMNQIGLLIFDEVHNLLGASPYAVLMRSFYRATPANQRPRVLGLTASMIEGSVKEPPTAEGVRAAMDELEQLLDAFTFCSTVEVPCLEPRFVRFDGAQPSPRAMTVMRGVEEAIAGACLELGEQGVDRAFAAIWARIEAAVADVGRQLGAWAQWQAAHRVLEAIDQPSSERAFWLYPEDEESGAEAAPPAAGMGVALRQRWSATYSELERRLRPLRKPPLDDSEMVSSKVAELVRALVEKTAADEPTQTGGTPGRTLVFAYRRQVCALLADMLNVLLPEALRPCVAVVGSHAASVRGLRGSGGLRGAACGARAHSAALHGLRTGEVRMLVATAVLAEGIDVASCDCVVRFDPPRSYREHAQSSGRARRDGSVLLAMVPASGAVASSAGSATDGGVEHWERLITCSALVRAELAKRAVRRPARGLGAIPAAPGASCVVDDCQAAHDADSTSNGLGGSAEARPASPTITRGDALAPLVVGSSGAILPAERAVPFLKDVYRERLSDGAQAAAKANYALGGKAFGDSNFVLRSEAGGFVCHLSLPRVGLCTAHPEEWVGERPWTAPRRTKELAVQSAALEAVGYMLSTGVLDDHLFVTGRKALRDEALARLGHERARARTSSTRLGSYERHTKQPFVRKLPRCLSNHGGGARACADKTELTAEPSWWERPWLTMMKLNGSGAAVALLLPSPVSLRFTVLTPEPMDVELESVCRVALGADDVMRLTRWLVGTLDLLQVGVLGDDGERLCEPLDPSLDAPCRVLAFDHASGTYSPAFVHEEGGGGDEARVPVAGSAVDNSADEPSAMVWAGAWRRRRAVACRSGESEEEALVSLILQAADGAARGSSVDSLRRPPWLESLVVVLDLDQTVWQGACEDLHNPAMGRAAITTLHGDHAGSDPPPTATLLEYLESEEALWSAEQRRLLYLYKDVRLIVRALRRAGVRIAAASFACRDAVEATLEAFGLRRDFAHVEAGRGEHKSKHGHLRRVADFLGVAPPDLLPFDDNGHHVSGALSFGCVHSVLVDGAEGLTTERLLSGIATWTERRCATICTRVSAGRATPNAAAEGDSEGFERSVGSVDSMKGEHLTAAEMRSDEGLGGADSGFCGDGYTEHELVMSSRDKRRKARQSRLSKVARSQAAVAAAGGASAKLAALDSPVGSWLAAPVPEESFPEGELTNARRPAACGIDWDLVDLAGEMFDTCSWPSLEEASHALCQGQLVRDGSAQHVALNFCVLVMKHRHAMILKNAAVRLDSNGRAVSVDGDYTPRTIRKNVRMPVGHGWANRPGRREEGVSPAEALALPVRSSALMALRNLSKLLWRLEHVALASDLVAGEVTAASGGPREQNDEPTLTSALVNVVATATSVASGSGIHGLQPAGFDSHDGLENEVRCKAKADTVLANTLAGLPLGLLNAALTNKGANAEAMDASYADWRGCTHYEVLEWLGDAVLELLAVVRAMNLLPEADEGRCTREKECVASNLALCRVAADVGLPSLCLQRPYMLGVTLPELRRQLLSRKDQADLFEACLGAVALHAALSRPGGRSDAAIALGGTHPTLLQASGRRMAGSSLDEELRAGPLCRAFNASGRLFHGSICLRSEVDPSRAMPSRWDSGCEALSACMPFVQRSLHGQVQSDCMQRAALLSTLLGFSFTRRADLLHELAFGWTRERPFQRLELLGDAVLEYAISFELISRRGCATDGSGPNEGDLTQVRSALVSNRSLGSRLVRRLGAPLVVGLLRRGNAITNDDAVAVIRGLMPQWDEWPCSALVKAGASLRATLAELAPADVDATPFSENAKQVGDLYEALVGAVVLELRGDIDAAWRVFRSDFFEPDPTDREHEATAADVLEELRLEAMYAQTVCEAKAKALEASALAQARPPHASSVTAPSEPSPPETPASEARPHIASALSHADVCPRIHAAYDPADFAVSPTANVVTGLRSDSIVGLSVHAHLLVSEPSFEESSTCLSGSSPPHPVAPSPSACVEVHSKVPSEAATSAAAGAGGAANTAPACVALAYPEEMGVATSHDWVSEVTRLVHQRLRMNPALKLENECSSSQPPFVFRVYDKTDTAREPLGEGVSTRNKKEAKNLAYMRAHRVLKKKLDSSEESISAETTHTAAADSLSLTAPVSLIPTAPTKEAFKNTMPAPETLPSKRFKSDTSLPAGHLTPDRHRESPVSPPHDFSTFMSTLLDGVGEKNEHYRRMIIRMAAVSSLTKEQLGALASSAELNAKVLRHPSANASVSRSAGRHFHDALKLVVAGEQSGSPGERAGSHTPLGMSITQGEGTNAGNNGS